MSKFTVICHFRNEEDFLVPWLKHHRRLFDHGIMIDYQSSDRSTEIIRELVPSWEVRPSRNLVFSTFPIDEEVMEIERGIKGWKIALNVTEFLIHHDLSEYIETLPEGSKGAATSGYVMQDHPGLLGTSLCEDGALWEERHFGYAEPDPVNKFRRDRSRILHNAPDGQYGPGRHSNGLDLRPDPALNLFWYGWSPLHLKVKRNLSTRGMLDPEDLEKGWGDHHAMVEAELMSKYENEYLPHCYNVLDGRHPELIDAVSKIRGVMYGASCAL